MCIQTLVSSALGHLERDVHLRSCIRPLPLKLRLSFAPSATFGISHLSAVVSWTKCSNSPVVICLYFVLDLISPSKGEQAATALEANLTHLESKLNAILAAIEANEAQKPKPTKPNDDAKSSSNGDEKPAKDATDKDDAA